MEGDDHGGRERIYDFATSTGDPSSLGACITARYIGKNKQLTSIHIAKIYTIRRRSKRGRERITNLR